MTRRNYLVLLTLFACAGTAIAEPQAEDSTRWTPELIRDAERWTHGRNDPSITVVEQGLRVAVPPERTWRIAVD